MTKSVIKREGRIRRWTRNCLLLVGLVALGVWAWSVASTAVFQDWEHWAFDHQVRGERATITGYLWEKSEEGGRRVRSWLRIPAGPKPAISRPNFKPPRDRQPFLERNTLVGRLAIPRLHVSGMVREGTGEDTLGLSLGHIPTSALPGQSGNVAVAGHRDTIFRGLRGIHKNDLIYFETFNGNYVYRVEATEIVKPETVSVLKPSQHPELTLVTCHPFYYVGSAPDRFIVKARQVSGPATEQNFPETQQGTAQQADSTGTERLQAAKQSTETPPAASHSGLHRAVRAARDLKGVDADPAVRKVTFSVSTNHSRELAPGISFGLTGTDAAYHRVNGWMWVMPDRRTIWLRDQSARQPVIFFSYRDGRKSELVITSVTKSSVSGYLLLPKGSRGNTALK
jgi:sortase A